MADDPYPVRWLARHAVVRLPEQITGPDAGRLGEQLRGLVDQGAAVLIADLTSTVSCDDGAADALRDAYQHARDNGTRLRVAVTAEGVRRVLASAGLDRLIAFFPSVQAAEAAEAPASVIPLTPRSARSRPGARPSEEAWPSGITPVLLWRMVDALADGVVLVDADGQVVLANRRAEEMFGYHRGQLVGHAVEALVPAGLRSAHESHRAGYQQQPVDRLMGDRARLAGLRQDGTTIPVRISISPVHTATGRFTMAVIRDISADQPPADLGELARAAVAAEDAQKSRDLLDRVVNGLFRVGLSLQSAAGLPHDIAISQIDEALQHVDDLIREIRGQPFGAPGRPPDGTPPGESRPGPG